MFLVGVNKEWTWQELYIGNLGAIKSEARYSASDNMHVIVIPKFNYQSLA